MVSGVQYRIIECINNFVISLQDSESHTNHISDSSSLDEDREMVRRDLGNRGAASLDAAKVCLIVFIYLEI